MSDEYTKVRGVKYPMLANISPEDMIEAYKMGEKKWRYIHPNGNYNLLLLTLSSLFENEVVATIAMGKTYMYFDINNIPNEFSADFPNNLFNPDDETRNNFVAISDE